MLSANSDCTKSENHINIDTKNHCEKIDKVSIQKLLLDNWKGFIDNCDIGIVSYEFTWTK